jgi:hypothetical protein
MIKAKECGLFKRYRGPDGVPMYVRQDGSPVSEMIDEECEEIVYPRVVR